MAARTRAARGRRNRGAAPSCRHRGDRCGRARRARRRATRPGRARRSTTRARAPPRPCRRRRGPGARALRKCAAVRLARCARDRCRHAPDRECRSRNSTRVQRLMACFELAGEIVIEAGHEQMLDPRVVSAPGCASERRGPDGCRSAMVSATDYSTYRCARCVRCAGCA